MLNACGETYETLKQYAETVDLDGVTIRTINLEGLLLTKQTMRDKDVSDRIILERALETFRARVTTQAPTGNPIANQKGVALALLHEHDIQYLEAINARL